MRRQQTHSTLDEFYGRWFIHGSRSFIGERSVHVVVVVAVVLREYTTASLQQDAGQSHSS